MNTICKKSLVIGIILLMFGVSVSSGISISKNVEVNSFNPKPDIECEGSIINHRVKPGYTFDSLFSIWNEGEEGSFLNWEIVSYPDWGSWSFNQLSGSNLEASEMVGIEVTITVPDERNGNFLGAIRVVNTDDLSDYDDVGVHITTTRSNKLKSNNEDDCGCEDNISTPRECDLILNRFYESYARYLTLKDLYNNLTEHPIIRISLLPLIIISFTFANIWYNTLDNWGCFDYFPPPPKPSIYIN